MLQCVAACCSMFGGSNTLPNATTRCNTLQHAATRCNTLYLSQIFSPPPLPLQTQKLSTISYTTARELTRRNHILLSSKTSKEPYTFAKEPHTSAKEPISPAKETYVSANVTGYTAGRELARRQLRPVVRKKWKKKYEHKSVHILYMR